MIQTDASEGAESIYRNRKVYTGYYKKFHALSQSDRDKVMAEREREGIKKGPQKKTGCQVSFAKTTEKELAATKRKLKKAIARFPRFRQKVITKATVPLVVVTSLLTTVETLLEAVKRRRKERRARRLDSSLLAFMAQLFNVIGFRLEPSDWIDFNEEREQERRRICDFITTDRRDCPERRISAMSRED